MSIHYEIRGPVALITIDRPDVRNAVDGPTADALADAVRRFGRTGISAPPCSPGPAGPSVPGPT